MTQLSSRSRLNWNGIWRYVKQLGDPSRVHILFLIPLASAVMDEGQTAMTREELLKSFPGNTIVSESATGTAYAYAEQGGTAKGMHPTFGKITGEWKIDADGVVCVTWPLPNANEIKNCSKTVALGGGQYNWANQVIRLQPGDVQNLAR